MMTSHSARIKTMREVSETVIICALLYFWNKFQISGAIFLGKLTLKVENLVFDKHETGVLLVEGFAEKFLVSFQAQSCPRLFKASPLTLPRQTAAYTSTSIFF